MLGYGIRHHVAGLGERFGPRAGVLVLGLFAAPVEIGLFAVAGTPMLYLNVIADTVGSALLPRIAGEAGERVALVALSLRVVLWSTAAALAAALAVCSPLVGLALPGGFAPIVPMLWIMAPGVLARAACGIFQTYFVGSDRPGVCSWAVWLGLSLNLAALILLYPELGVRAAAWSLTLGMSMRCLLLAILYRRATGTRWSLLWAPQRGDPAFLAASVALGLPPRPGTGSCRCLTPPARASPGASRWSPTCSAPEGRSASSSCSPPGSPPAAGGPGCWSTIRATFSRGRWRRRACP